MQGRSKQLLSTFWEGTKHCGNVKICSGTTITQTRLKQTITLTNLNVTCQPSPEQIQTLHNAKGLSSRREGM